MKRFCFYSGVFLVASSTLMLQVVQTRILSVVAWYYLAFFVISIAMFGLTACSGGDSAGTAANGVDAATATNAEDFGSFDKFAEEFKAAARSEKGLASIGIAAQLLALTAYDLIDRPELLTAIKEDHAKHLAKGN